MRIAIETSGCAFNEADGETLGALVSREGHDLVDNAAGADVVVLNSCTVKDTSFRNFERRLRELDAEGRAVVIAGCIPTAHRALPLWEGRVILGIHNLTDIGEAVRRAAAREAGAFCEGTPRRDRLELPARPHSPVIEVLPINQGCLSKCSFCETKFSRGDLVSYPLDAILARAAEALDRGAVELWLTSQDTSVWGRDIGARLCGLLDAMAALPGQFRIRLGMANPRYLADQLDEVIRAMQSEHYFRFLHIPLQSGSDTVLRAMNRGYTAAEWIALCRALRRSIPDLTLATDVIVGFPGETDADFAATLDALETIRPEVVNRSKFSARPLTAAAQMPRVAGEAVRRRSMELDALVRRLTEDSLRRLIGTRVRCLVDQQRRAGSVMARTDSYRPVALTHPREEDATPLLGTFREVEIVRAAQWHAVGRLARAPETAARANSSNPGVGPIEFSHSIGTAVRS